MRSIEIEIDEMDTGLENTENIEEEVNRDENGMDYKYDKAERHNTGKPQLSYILEAPDAMEGLSAVLEYGCKKYGRGNWKKGLATTEIIDSLLRHLLAYQNGEIIDKESQLPHTAHLLANAIFLCDQGIRERKQQEEE